MLSITRPRSSRLFLKKADKKARQIANRLVIINDGVTRVRETQAPDLSMAIMDCCVAHDLPKSKVKTDLRMSKYCINQGLSKPSWCRSSAICLAVAYFPNITTVGSPATTLNSKKISKETPIRTGMT